MVPYYDRLPTAVIVQKCGVMRTMRALPSAERSQSHFRLKPCSSPRVSTASRQIRPSWSLILRSRTFGALSNDPWQGFLGHSPR